MQKATTGKRDDERPPTVPERAEFLPPREMCEAAKMRTPPRATSRATAIGERVYASLERKHQIVHHGEDAELCDELAARLQHGQKHPHQVVLFEGPNYEAFTAPGRYIFISHAMVRLPISVASVAFMIAHEIGHHQCGHLSEERLPAWWRLNVPRDPVLDQVAMNVLRSLRSPQFELEADRAGLELCLGAGFDGRSCLKIFDLLMELGRRAGAQEIALGPQTESEWRARLQAERAHPGQEVAPVAERLLRWAIGRPSLMERKTRLLALLSAAA